jgi:peptidyl-prolyl cis-trans isomerase SurA
MMPSIETGIRNLSLLALTIAVILAAPLPARAQVVAIVGGEPITEVDIHQRTRLIELSTQKKPSRQEALDDLIDDKLKVQLSKRYIADVPKREIETAYANIARRAGMTPAQFAKTTAASGVTAEALKARIHADYVWGQIVRGKFQGSLQVGDKEVEVKMQGTGSTPEPTNYEYKLQPVLFLVPRGAAPAAFEARKKDAEALRARFQSCEEGLRSAAALSDVAVRATITRQSSDLGEAQRKVLNDTAVGRLTPPDVTPQGVEVFAICSKTVATGDSPTKRKVRDEMFNERYQALSKKFLKELRSHALIEYK